MDPEGVAFLAVLAAVGAVPGVAALVAHRASSRRVELRLNEVLAILRARQTRRPIGYEMYAREGDRPDRENIER